MIILNAEPWMVRAACADGSVDARLFDRVRDGDVEESSSEKSARYELAASVCAGCPVLDECRSWAMSTGDAEGVLGGELWRRCRAGTGGSVVGRARPIARTRRRPAQRRVEPAAVAEVEPAAVAEVEPAAVAEVEPAAVRSVPRARRARRARLTGCVAVRINDELWNAAQAKAARESVTVSGVLRAALARYVDGGSV